MSLPRTNWRVSLVALLLGAGAVAAFSGTASAAPGRKTPAPLVVTTGTLRYTGGAPMVVTTGTLHYAGGAPMVITTRTLRYTGR
jgi:hypothetical protein